MCPREAISYSTTATVLPKAERRIAEYVPVEPRLMINISRGMIVSILHKIQLTIALIASACNVAILNQTRLKRASEADQKEAPKV